MKKKRQEFFRGTVIKKIMQLDESVGKMTSLAPDAIGKFDFGVSIASKKKSASLTNALHMYLLLTV